MHRITAKHRPMRSKDMRSFKSNLGMGLLDTMIALVVVAVGIMAAMTLFGKSTSSSSSASYQMIATDAANLLIENMRANNPDAATAGNYNINTATNYNAPDCATPSTNTCINNTNPCTYTQISEASLRSMVCNADGLFQSLPNPELQSICSQPANSSRIICSVSVSWKSFRDNNTKSVTFNDVVL